MNHHVGIINKKIRFQLNLNSIGSATRITQKARIGLCNDVMEIFKS